GNPENSSLYICGNFQEDAAFDDILLTNWGGLDMFVAKLNHGNDFINESTNTIISVFPNPSNGTFLLKLEEFDNKDITIQIFSADGKLVLEKHISDAKKSIEIKTDLTSGVYNLHIPELELNSKLIIK
ncbi:MAG: T9SS type A sorting domain-containing protein, partial [Bacteroidota bacterium]